jgi:hypothetical protein
LRTFSVSNSVAQQSKYFRWDFRIESGNTRNSIEGFMLGEKIGEVSGKLTMQRVLPNLGGDPKMETSFVLGANVKDTDTHSIIFRPDGTQYGERQGIMVTEEGKTATWTGHGLGTLNKDGTATYCGALYFQTMPQERLLLPRWQCYSRTQ